MISMIVRLYQPLKRRSKKNLIRFRKSINLLKIMIIVSSVSMKQAEVTLNNKITTIIILTTMLVKLIIINIHNTKIKVSI